MTEQYPKVEELFAERDRLFKKHPKTHFIAAHLAWHGNDYGRRAEPFDEYPNVYGGARRRPLRLRAPAPRNARFFTRYQDRILSGRTPTSRQNTRLLARFETADEYFDYYRGYHAFWKLTG